MERLQKVMAHMGVASRRKCEQLILDGRVSVNGQVVRELGVKVTTKDRIEVDFIPIYKEEPRYILFYKPRQVISAVSDDKNRTVVSRSGAPVQRAAHPAAQAPAPPVRQGPGPAGHRRERCALNVPALRAPLTGFWPVPVR